MRRPFTVAAILFLTLLLIVITLGIAGGAAAQPLSASPTPVPIGSPQQIVTGSHDMVNPALAYNPGANEFLLVWEQSYPGRTKGVTFGAIYAQRMTPDGTPLGTAVRLSTPDEDTAYSPAVAYNPVFDEYMVVWHAYLGDLPGDIYGRRVSAAGEALGQIQPISTAPGSQRWPVLAVNPDDGSYFAAWTDNRDFGTQRENIYGVRLDELGMPTQADVPIAAADNRQDQPAIALDRDAGQYVVAWADRRTDVDLPDIYAQNLTVDGALSGENYPITTANHAQQEPFVLNDSLNARVVVYWQDNNEFQGSDIYSRWVDNAEIMGRIQYVEPALAEQLQPAAATDGNQRSLVVWEDSRYTYSKPTPIPYDIAGLCTDMDGSPVSDLYWFATAAGDNNHPQVAYASGPARYFLVWQHKDEGDGAHYEIWGQPVTECITAATTPTPVPPTPIPTVPAQANHTYLPLIVR